MIKQSFINGVDISTGGYHPISLTGGASAGITHKSYPLGSRHGVALGTPRYRSLLLKYTTLIIGTSVADYITKRNNFLKLFRLARDSSSVQTKQFKIVDGNNKVKIADVVISDVSGDLNSENKHYGEITVIMETDREYLRGDDKSASVYLSKVGGFAIPFGIPFDMSAGTGAQLVELVNEGNTDSYPVVRVTGDMDGFTLNNSTTGESLTCSENLGVNDYIDIDFYNRSVMLNGLSNKLSTISGDWWTLIPGSNVMKLISATSSTVANAAFTYQNAYIGL